MSLTQELLQYDHQPWDVNVIIRTVEAVDGDEIMEILDGKNDVS